MVFQPAKALVAVEQFLVGLVEVITVGEFRLALLLLVRLDPLIERSSSECSPLFFEVVFHGKIHNFF